MPYLKIICPGETDDVGVEFLKQFSPSRAADITCPFGQRKRRDKTHSKACTVCHIEIVHFVLQVRYFDIYQWASVTFINSYVALPQCR